MVSQKGKTERDDKQHKELECNEPRHLGALDHFPVIPHFLLLGPFSLKPTSHSYFKSSLKLKLEPVYLRCGITFGLPQGLGTKRQQEVKTYM